MGEREERMGRERKKNIVQNIGVTDIIGTMKT